MINYKNYQEFYFKEYNYYYLDDFLNIEYFFEIKNLDKFKTTYKIPYKTKILNSFELDKLIFYLGLVESLSVYKLTVAKKIVVQCNLLNNEEEIFFQKLIKLGLGEFFYINNLKYEEIKPEIVSFHKDKFFNKHNYNLKGLLIPIGGGKDSVVSLELLSQFKDITLFSLNSLPSAKKCIEISAKPSIEVSRTFDLKIVNYNKKGFYNGHTPFSAMLSFVCAITALLNDIKTIMLSNENSANETTVIGEEVNHQYSKSLEYENDFRDLLKKQLPNLEIEYLSYLRPLSEIQITKIFSKYRLYHKAFSSCNLGSKQGIWCNKCAKCLFVFIMLSAFLDEKSLLEIFKKDLFESLELIEEFNQLIGEARHKPFECVGTIDEINVALVLALKKYPDKVLLKYYKTTDSYKKYQDFIYDFKQINPNHNLKKLYLDSIIKEL